MFQFLRKMFFGCRKHTTTQPEPGPRFTMSSMELASNVGRNVDRAIVQRAMSLREKDGNGSLSETGFPLVTEEHIHQAICELGLESYGSM